MLSELERHPHARAVLAPAMASAAAASHAYLFHGPGGSGKRSAARAFAAALLAEGSADPDSARRRAVAGAHPDLTWVRPSGAHEILVSDIEGPVVAAATRTPFEARRRVFVIERADELGDEAANRMLKTLEEPASYVHIILTTDRLAEVLPTIRSRCQVVRFDAPASDEIAHALIESGVETEQALACARLSLGDRGYAAELASDAGGETRAAAELFARAPLAGADAPLRPWTAIMQAVKSGGEAVSRELAEARDADLALYPVREQKRVRTEWEERSRRARRRAETAALDRALELVSLWYADLEYLALGAEDLVRNVDRLTQLAIDGGLSASSCRTAIELVEETRLRFTLNVTEDLALEALALRLGRLFA